MTEIKVIKGDKHSDERGTVCFVNNFDMSPVKRMYTISHSNTSIKRGWRGHKLEQRWFYTVEGSFEVSIVKIDNWENPNPGLEIKTYKLTADQPTVLHVPTGYASGLRAIIPGSKLVIYADTHIENAINDNYQYPSDYFVYW